MSGRMLRPAARKLLDGITAYPLARRYGERLAATRDRAREEHQPVSELPVRIRHAKEAA